MDVFGLLSGSPLRAVVEYFGFVRVYLKSNSSSFVDDFADHVCQLFEGCGEDNDIVGEAQVGECVTGAWREVQSTASLFPFGRKSVKDTL